MPRSTRSPSTGDVREKRRSALSAGLLLAAVFIVYGQVASFEFVDLDDPVYVADSHVQQGLSLRSIAWSFGSFHDSNWIPLTWLSLMLDADLYGSRPGGYHLTNVLLHAVNTVLLFAVLLKATGDSTRSAFVAALFGLHPLHVESVAWVSERKDVLSILFGLLSLLAYVGYAKSGRWRNLAFSWFYFVCSLLAKQTLVTLPFVFLLLDYWPLGRMGRADPRPGSDKAGETFGRRPAGRLVLEKGPFVAVSAVFSVVAVFAQRSGWHALGSLEKFPLAGRCMNALVAYAAYLGQIFVPRDLSVFYPHPGASLTWSAAAAAGALLAAVSVAAVIGIRRYPFLFVGWAWYLGTLVPMIGLVQIGYQQMADRYTYFPSIGLFLALAWLVPALMPAGILRARLLPWVGAAALLLLGGIAFVQVGYWHDGVSLERHALDCTPDQPFVMCSLGQSLVGQGDVDGGMALLESAVRIPPPSAKWQFGLAIALQRTGRIDEAIKHYQAAIAIEDSNPETENNLGFLFHSRGQLDEAQRAFARAIEVGPDYAASYLNMGVVCVAKGEYAAAIDWCERALSLEPDLPECHFTIASALRAQGRIDEAIRQYEMELDTSPRHPRARQELEGALAIKRGS